MKEDIQKAVPLVDEVVERQKVEEEEEIEEENAESVEKIKEKSAAKIKNKMAAKRTRLKKRKKKKKSVTKKRKRTYIPRCYLRIPREMNKLWEKKTKVKPAREYKYAMKKALQDKDSKIFLKKLQSFRMSMTDEAYCEELIKAGIGQQNVHFGNRTKFVEKVMRHELGTEPNSNQPVESSEDDLSDEETQLKRPRVDEETQLKRPRVDEMVCWRRVGRVLVVCWWCVSVMLVVCWW